MKSIYFSILIYFIAMMWATAQINSPLPQSIAERSMAIKLKIKSCSIHEFDVINDIQQKTSNFDSTHYDVLGNIVFECWGWPNGETHFKYITEYVYDSENRLISKKIAQYVGNNMQGPVDCTIYQYDHIGNLLQECTPVMEKEQLSKDFCTSYIYSNGRLVECNTTEGNYLYQYRGDTLVMLNETDNDIIERYYNGHTVSKKYEDGKEYFYYYNKKEFMIESKGIRNGFTEDIIQFEYENGLLKRAIFKDGNLRTNSIEVYNYTFYR